MSEQDNQERQVAMVRRWRREVSGQAIFERELERALGLARPEFVRTLEVGGTRSHADVRLPDALQRRLPFGLRRMVGTALFRSPLVHRLDLGVPPTKGEILTVHDLAPLRYPDEGSLPQDARRSIQDAAVVITGSEFTAAEIRDYADRPDVRVVSHGVDERFFTASRHSASKPFPSLLDRPYVLHAGGTSHRKNLRALVRAWPAVRAEFPDLQLAMVGPPSTRRSALVDRSPAITYVGQFERPALIALMRDAEAVVVPSLYEGFGLPVLEALACGVPVVSSNAASLPEVAGGAAILCEPTVDGLAEGLIRSLRGGEHVAALVERGRVRSREFSWARAASQHLDIYDAGLARKSGV
jgi:glycosyltransferase involved in cell wall biosynthesis